MNNKQRKTLEAVFTDPASPGISWDDIENLFRACGAAITAGKGARETERGFGDFPPPASAAAYGQGRSEIRKTFSCQCGSKTMSVITYKGYQGTFEYDPQADIFHGEVLNLTENAA